jgi:hypothetical protein
MRTQFKSSSPSLTPGVPQLEFYNDVLHHLTFGNLKERSLRFEVLSFNSNGAIFSGMPISFLLN